jgi:signal transduction histidine kinase
MALVAMGAATKDEDLTTPLNWALPTTVGTTACVGATMDGPEANVTASVLAAAYAISVRRSVRRGMNPAGIGVSMIGYWGIMWVVRVTTSYINGYSEELADLSEQAIEDETRLATERERNRQHRVLHDSALQTLEAIGAGWDTGSAHLRADAAREAGRLRRWLNDEDADANDLEVGLAVLSSEFVGLHVEVVCEPLDAQPPPASAMALCDATREALRNVVKHAGTASAIVRCTASGDRIEETVRDHGRGFDRGSTPAGFGTTSSIIDRLHECGGGADIWSAPGRGTRVRLWAPR